MIEVFARDLDGVWFGVAYRRDEIVATWFGATQQDTLSGLLSTIPYDEPFQTPEKPSALAAEVVASLKRVYDGEGVAALFPLAYSTLPAYTQRVLKATFRVPVGYVTTYGALAEAVGGGARAVGNVMASNPFAPLVPCHRVVKSDLTLGGYGGGLKTKVELLNREKRGFSSPIQVQVDGGSLAVFPVEFVLKKLPPIFR